MKQTVKRVPCRVENVLAGLYSLTDFQKRFLLSFIFYSVFVIFYAILGFYVSAIITLILSISIVFYFFYDDIKSLTISWAYASFGVIVYLVVIIGLYQPVSWEQLGQTLIKVVFEEVLFRLIMLGIMKKYLNLLNVRMIFAVLIVNSLFFTTLHIQYRTAPEYATIFVQSTNFGLTYLSLGILPSITNHLLWNLFFPNILPQIPISVAAILYILYVNYQEERRIRSGRIMHLK